MSRWSSLMEKCYSQLAGKTRYCLCRGRWISGMEVWCRRTETRKWSRDNRVTRNKIWCMMSSPYPSAQVVQYMASGLKGKEPTAACWYSPQTVVLNFGDGVMQADWKVQAVKGRQSHSGQFELIDGRTISSCTDSRSPQLFATNRGDVSDSFLLVVNDVLTKWIVTLHITR